MRKWICALLILILALALAVPSSAASYTVAEPKWVTVDGKISEEEWGKPIYKGVTLQQAEEGKVDDTVTCWWFDGSNNADASFDLYLTHNDINIYVGCVIHNVDAETSTDALAWQQMNFSFTLSDYHEGTDVRRITYQGKEWEAYTGYRIYLTSDGKIRSQALTQGLTAKNLYAGTDYTAVYDPSKRTMTYEVAVPFSYTLIDTARNLDIAFSAVVALEHYNNTVSGLSDGSNRFLVGTGTAFCGGAEKWAHQDQCIKIKLVAPEQVLEAQKDQTQTVAPPTSNRNTDLTVPISSEPEYKVITADETISTPLIIILASIAVVILCAVAVTVTLVRERNKKAAAMNAAAGEQEGEQE